MEMRKLLIKEEFVGMFALSCDPDCRVYPLRDKTLAFSLSLPPLVYMNKHSN